GDSSSPMVFYSFPEEIATTKNGNFPGRMGDFLIASNTALSFPMKHVIIWYPDHLLFTERNIP
ncbi:MAG: hypothetical protein LUG17_03020, partial [Clostridiales bacterium]|nr:hypothetical protein [Clostridiales bacterium]